MDIKLHPKAQEDLDSALEYYYNVDTTLRSKFINSLDATFTKILKFPDLYTYETKVSQKVLMETFPYIIIYEQYQNNIMVLAIFHTKREPTKKNIKI